jgi:regulation of enolase protein 1 (concanavalin A-like superfamily)
MQWLNEPPVWQAHGGWLRAVTGSKTDFWRVTTTVLFGTTDTSIMSKEPVILQFRSKLKAIIRRCMIRLVS